MARAEAQERFLACVLNDGETFTNADGCSVVLAAQAHDVEANDTSVAQGTVLVTLRAETAPDGRPALFVDLDEAAARAAGVAVSVGSTSAPGSDEAKAKGLLRLFEGARASVERRWGTEALGLLGPEMRRALLAEAVLRLCADQDESVPASKVRLIAERGFLWAQGQVD